MYLENFRNLHSAFGGGTGRCMAVFICRTSSAAKARLWRLQVFLPAVCSQAIERDFKVHLSFRVEHEAL